MGGLFEFESTDENELNGNETPLRSKKQIVDHRQSILMELQNSLNDPSLIESTPLVTNAQLKTNRSNGVAIANHQFHKKKLSRLALDNNFSPIVFHVSLIVKGNCHFLNHPPTPMSLNIINGPLS